MRNLLAAFLLFIGALVSLPAYAQDANNMTAENQATAGDNAVAPEAGQGSRGPEAREPARDEANDPRVLPESGQALVKLFVLAVLLESALALLFNWRPFIVYFDGRAMKPLVSFGAALVVVFVFRLHTLEDLLEAYGSGDLENSGRMVSQILEAMIIAGGSSGVNNLLRSLGFRAIPSIEQEQRRPPDDKAWLSVGLRREKAVGPVEVQLAPQGTVGSIAGTQRKSGFLNYFLKDSGRYPPSEGFSVTPGTEYEVSVCGVDAAGQVQKTETPRKVKLAPGAMVDLEFTL